MPEKSADEIPSWLPRVADRIVAAIWEYRTFDAQFSGDNPDKGSIKQGPEPQDLVIAAQKAAKACRALDEFHLVMMQARRGWDRAQIDRLKAVEDMHHAILGAIIDGVRPPQLAGWSDAELADAMPQIDLQSPINFSDPVNRSFVRIAARIENVVDAFKDGSLQGTRPVNNRRDRLVGRLGDIWKDMEGANPKAGSKVNSAPWPFERFVNQVWELLGETPPQGRLIGDALARWDAISAQSSADI